MSLMNRLEQAIKATPGLTTRQAAQAIGITDTKGIARVSALLHQCAERGKLRREGTARRMRHYPTEKTGVDQRALKRTPTSRRALNEAKKAAAKPQRPKATTTPKPAARAMQRPKPSAEQVASVSALFAKRTPRLKTLTGEETVDEFIQRGGVIQRLPPSACSRPLASFTADDDFLPL